MEELYLGVGFVNAKRQRSVCATMIPIKGVAVGDGMVGKLCLAQTHARNAFPEDQILLENFSLNVEVNGQEIDLTIIKLPGQEEYERFRSMHYVGTNVVLICFNIADRITFDNVRAHWIHEVRKHCPKVPLILVGCKADLRGDATKPTSYTAGAKLAKEIKIKKYVECSAKTRVGLKRVFEEAIIHALDSSRQNDDEGDEAKLCTLSCLQSDGTSAPFYKSSALTFDQLLNGADDTSDTKLQIDTIKLIRVKYEDGIGNSQLDDKQVRKYDKAISICSLKKSFFLEPNSAHFQTTPESSYQA